MTQDELHRYLAKIGATRQAARNGIQWYWSAQERAWIGVRTAGANGHGPYEVRVVRPKEDCHC